MLDHVNLKEFRGEAVRAYLQDGLVELSAGIVFIWWAVSFLVHVFLDVQVTSFCWLPWIAITFTLPAVKKRFTYPRIGHVEVVFQKERILLVLLLAGLVGIAAMFFLGIVVTVGSQDPASSLPRAMIDALFSNLSAVIGVGLAGVFLLIAYRYRIGRYYAFALVSIVSGLIFAMVTFDPWPRDPVHWSCYFSVMGIVLMVSGLVLFIRLLRKAPLQTGGTGELDGNTLPGR
jgi:hypothetical protein